jgi:hypothetical protein
MSRIVTGVKCLSSHDDCNARTWLIVHNLISNSSDFDLSSTLKFKVLAPALIDSGLNSIMIQHLLRLDD